MEQLTFTEKEIQGVADFVNFVYLKAKWEVTTKESHALTKHLGAMTEHLKKMEAHKLELKKVTSPEPEKKKTDKDSD